MSRAEQRSSEVSSSIVRRAHTCMGCNWHRDVVAGPQAQQKYWRYGVGMVSYEQGARLDISAHDCEMHRLAVATFKKGEYVNA